MKNYFKLVLLALAITSNVYAQGVIPRPGGAPNYKTAVANVAALPATGNATGDARITLDTVDIYIWDGAAWQLRSGSGGSSGITDINGLSGASQTIVAGTAGTDFAVSSAGTAHTLNLPTASAVNRGALSSANWSTFNAKEPAITATTSADYYRGDKTFQNFASAAQAASISQVITNGVTTKSPSEDAVFDALALKAPLASPALTGNPTAPTQTAADNSTKIATTAYADSAAAASIVQTIINGDTTHASSSDALFDALALKEALANKDSTITLGTSNTLYPTQNAVKVYADTKVLRQPITFSQTVSVNYLSGSDVACPATPCGDGSIDKPFQTIVTALASITDATASKPYVIALSADNQIESADILSKPYVSMRGVGQKPTVINLSGFDIKPSASHATSDSIIEFSDLVIGGGGIIWDLQALGGAHNSYVYLDNVQIDDNSEFKGRNGFISDTFEIHNVTASNSLIVDSAYFIVYGGELASTVDISNSQLTAGGVFVAINSAILDSTLTIDGVDVTLTNVSYPGGGAITTLNTVSINSYRGLPAKSARTLSGGTTINNIDRPSALAYTPTTSGNWSIVPTDVQEALDNLAAATAGAGTGDVTGPAASIDSEVAIYNGTTGKIIKRATGTGVAHLTAGVLSASAVVLTSEVSGVLPLANGGYTATQARSDLIASSIVNGDLTHSPDGNSVFDALALKQDAINFAVFPFSIIPDADLTRSLGDLTHRFSILYTNNLAISNHIVSNGSASVATVDANAGTSATCAVSAQSNDISGKVTLVSGSGAWATGTQCSIAFASAYASAPKCTFSPKNSATATLSTNQFISTSTTALVMNFTDADIAATTYIWDYICAE